MAKAKKKATGRKHPVTGVVLRGKLALLDEMAAQDVLTDEERPDRSATLRVIIQTEYDRRKEQLKKNNGEAIQS